VIVAAPATLIPAPRACTSRRISVVRHVRGSGGAQIRKEEGGRGQGVWMFIRPGAFQTMEHLLAMRVSVPASPGRMHIHSARGISDNGALVGDEG
jgi:hypothetical protein